MALATPGRRAIRTSEDGATRPRAYLFDELFAHRYDESILNGGGLRLTERLPGWARLAAEVQRRRDDYDVVVSWNERLTFALMALQSISRRGKPHVAMMYWFSRPATRAFMRAFSASLRAIVTWSSVQRSYAIEQLGFSAEKSTW